MKFLEGYVYHINDSYFRKVKDEKLMLGELLLEKNTWHTQQYYCRIYCVGGLSPNGKAVDSDSTISRFES